MKFGNVGSNIDLQIDEQNKQWQYRRQALQNFKVNVTLKEQKRANRKQNEQKRYMSNTCFPADCGGYLSVYKKRRSWKPGTDYVRWQRIWHIFPDRKSGDTRSE